MKKIKSIVFRSMLAFTALVLFSCGGGDGGGEEPPEEQSNPPTKAIGTLPANGEPCSDYEEVANDALKVMVAFKWNAAQRAQSYVLVVAEGSTEVFRNSSSALEAQVQLDRGKTYSWSLTSINNDGETGGDTYSFTTPGIPQGNFAPYAADITVEFNTQNSELSVSWVGSDEDGDQLVYDVTISENDVTLIEENDYDQSSIAPIAYIDGEDYTVEIVSKDTFGNFSISRVEERAPN